MSRYLSIYVTIGLFAVMLRAGETPANFQTDQLVPWCIVPFDAKKRGPAERAEMLVELGLKRCAYDWRKAHVDTFEEEILQYKKHGIEFTAFWGGHDKAFDLFKKHGIHPQIWRTAPSPKADTQAERVEAAARAVEPLVKQCAEYDCAFGLYNHGGWGGEPANLVAVCKRLHELGHKHVGIVYNWHHGHDQLQTWATDLAQMKPHLICLNLNGMNPKAAPKILALGAGKHEAAMLKTVLESGYKGPIGILDHQNHLDSRVALQANLDGLEKLLGKAP